MACSVENCEGDVWAAGLCSKHYNRLRSTGTTEDGPKARKPLTDRFWASVDFRGPNECWTWKRASKTAGYGVISCGGRGQGKTLAHRLAWRLANGEIPSSDLPHGMVIMHTCDNRLCCNPAHLRLGTQAENVRDMDKKGRRKVKAHKGDKHPNSKLTDEMVRALRAGDVTPEEVSAKTGMLRKSVLRVKNDRKLWKHIK